MRHPTGKAGDYVIPPMKFGFSKKSEDTADTADKPDAGARLFVPTSAVVRRAEMNTLYVVDAKGVPMLRLVRLGRAQGDQVEVLSGVSAGEQVALDPQAAARQP